jgi:protein O-mannosyl-transferase
MVLLLGNVQVQFLQNICHLTAANLVSVSKKHRRVLFVFCEDIMIKNIKIYGLLFLILLTTYFIYSKGLLGDYVFDDSINILENSKLAITTLDYTSLKAAFFSGDAGPLGRPISMLSFALNHCFTGFDPYYFKLTNLFIHLINGVFVYLLSLFVFEKLNFKSQLKKELIPYFALAASFIWLIHPINLTSVLYVVQRMTSLSTLFGLLMLVLYCYWRNRSHKTLQSTILCFGGMFFSFLASIFSKESGILFLGLLYWVELLIFQGKNIFQQDIYIGKFKLIHILWSGFALGLLLVMVISLPFIFTGNLGNRNFNTIERLLTESRVIFYYLKMIIS